MPRFRPAPRNTSPQSTAMLLIARGAALRGDPGRTVVLVASASIIGAVASLIAIVEARRAA